MNMKVFSFESVFFFEYKAKKKISNAKIYLKEPYASNKTLEYFRYY